MADNIVLNLGSGGDTTRALDRTAAKTQVVVLDFGAPGAGNESLVAVANALPVSINAANFIVSAGNSSAVQLAPGATFAGAIETALTQPSISLLETSDQNMRVVVRQFVDVAGLYEVAPIVFNLLAGQSIDQSFPLNGNYYRTQATNVGTNATTTFNVSTALGTIGAATNLGNVPIAINEIGGVSIAAKGSLPVSVGAPSSGLVTNEFNLNNALSNDAPIGTFLTGDPGGDFAGINLLEEAFKGNLQLPVTTDIKKDVSGAVAIQDGAVFYGTSMNTGIPLVSVFDTTGYNSVNIYCGGGTATVNVQFSEDGVFWNNGLVSSNSSAFSASAQSVYATSPINIVSPITGRYCRVNMPSYTSGTVFGVARLRSAQVNTVNSLAILNTQITNATGSSYPPEDSAIGSMPTLITGGKVRTAIAPNTLIAGDASMNTFNDSAALIVENHAVRQLTWNYAAATLGIVNTITAVTIKTAVASQRGNITSMSIQSEALTTATEFAIRDGAAGAVLWRIKIPTTGLPLTPIQFDPPLSQTAVNTLLEIVTLTASGAGAVYFNCNGFMSN